MYYEFEMLDPSFDGGETFDIDFLNPEPEPEIPEDEAVDVTYRTQSGRVGVATIDESASDMYVEEFLQVMGAMYKKLTFVNDLKIEINYGDRVRTMYINGYKGDDMDG